MVEVRQVRSRRQLHQFISFPDKIYQKNPYYVPPLRADEKMNLTPGRNPVFKHSKIELFLAYRNNKVVGRVCVILHRPYNEKWDQRRVRFTRLDFIDDREVSQALMDRAESWAREQGMTQLHGPLGFCDLDREGMLIEGFEEQGTIVTIYNAPYYQTHLEAMGYTKDADWIELQIMVPEAGENMKKIGRIAEMVRNKLNLRMLQFTSMKQVEPYFTGIFDLLDEAYQSLYGVVPLNSEQRALYLKQFLSFVQPEFVEIVLDSEGVMAGFGLAVPSLSAASKRCGGKLFPLGWLTALRALKRYQVLDLYLVAVKPQYQGKGVNALLIDDVVRKARERGVRYAESGPELETNERVQAQWKYFEARQHKRRRCWIKQL